MIPFNDMQTFYEEFIDMNCHIGFKFWFVYDIFILRLRYVESKVSLQR